MNVLHYHVHILTITDPKMSDELRKNRCISRAVITELDDTHWLIEEKHIPDIERQCARLNIPIKVVIHG
ncbi:hypothetical protein IKW72_00850 [bacterium]|nr:hypothetical protein [bacterium]